MSKPQKLRDLLKDWLDVASRYEKGMIPENAFLRVHTTLSRQASGIKPTTTEEACAQLLLAVLMWKEENGDSTFPFHVAIDKMLGHVVDFMENMKDINKIQDSCKWQGRN